MVSVVVMVGLIAGHDVFRSLFNLNGSMTLKFYIFFCIYIFGSIDSHFVLLCNKGILRHPASVTCVTIAES